jgi:hypothetical protein
MQNLTKKEQKFIKEFLSSNGCGATNSQELLEDNFSCQCFTELEEIFEYLNKYEISGLLSSLMKKQVLWCEDERGSEINYWSKKMEKIPDLYWVNEWFLEENPKLEF